MTWAWRGSSKGSREAGTVRKPRGLGVPTIGRALRDRLPVQPLVPIKSPNLVWTGALLTLPDPVQEESPGISRGKHPFEVFGLLLGLPFFQLRKPASLSLYAHPSSCPNLSSPGRTDGFRVSVNEFVLKCECLRESSIRQTEPRHKIGRERRQAEQN